MEKVTFTFKNGREKVVSPRDGEMLRRLGKGSYLTRDMANQPKIEKAFPGTNDPRTPEEVDAQIKAESSELQGDDLDALDVDALRALAGERQVSVHHRAGVEKIRAALREAAE